jgi:hypothetical protein
MGPLPRTGFPGAPGTSAGDGEVLAWLTAMGFAVAEAQSAVARLPKGDGSPTAVEDRVRQALLILRPE